MRLHARASHVDQTKGKTMIDQTYWVVRLEAFSFDTKEEADAFRDKMEDAVAAMPEAADVTLWSGLREEKNDRQFLIASL